ncbi:hypothetical protein O1611_g8666 [Lasiodiplodia mahajangana]|uniref:Uncharacterized protein n=1 Tax=Lasiodiplodia mahajangana TaxID=1108764 RepID=A0ACC2JC99_9PEZI|nr:hypothetical protein O1611_g8666 [Lasiodiplodia mahajangana]
MHFRPSSSFSTRQHEIRAIDIDNGSNTLVAGTRESISLYPIRNHDPTYSNNTIEPPYIDPTTSISLKGAPQSCPFDFIRSTKILNQETIAVALSSSFDPIRILTVIPTGLEISTPVKAPGKHLSLDASPRTVRALLPIDVRSIASGGGNVLLSSWDDGTIRLQDLRSPSPVDRVYQDNFEISAPTSALISYGLERFVAGSAYAPVLKVFDFRWAKGYYHTDSLPCTSDSPYPTPRPPTIVYKPAYPDNRPFCDHTLGHLCRWHTLSRHDFYRPNYNIYLPFRTYASSPIYSLAKPSDVSPTIYAGLSSLLAEFTLRSGMHSISKPNASPLYSRYSGKVSILETGDGSMISDVTKSQRVPHLRRQSFRNSEHGSIIARRHHRLDEPLQWRYDWQGFEPSAPRTPDR